MQWKPTTEETMGTYWDSQVGERQSVAYAKFTKYLRGESEIIIRHVIGGYGSEAGWASHRAQAKREYIITDT